MTRPSLAGRVRRTSNEDERRATFLVAAVMIAASATTGTALPALAVSVTIVAILVLLATWERLDRTLQGRRLARVDVA